MALRIPSKGLSALPDDEEQIAKGLMARLRQFQKVNDRQDSYYDAVQRTRDLGIAIPPHLRDLEAAIGWPAMAVDVLGERLVHDGWIVPGGEDLGLDEIIAANKLDRELRSGRTKAMRYGIAFGVAGTGNEDEGEANPLVTVESPTRMTVTWDRRRKRVTEALLLSTDEQGKLDGATLWYDDVIVELTYADRRWTVEERSTHSLARPPVVRLVNRYSAGEGEGASEITRPLRTATDNAVRTIIAMEVSRDFYAAPKFWLLGADESSFVGPDGKPKTAWETYIGRLNAISSDGSGNTPKVETFDGASPTPFLEQLRGLAQMVSAETALPISYLGLVHDANPASADAALVSEARLNLRAEERQADFGEDEGELMRIAVWIRDGKDPGVTPTPDWRPAATPTLSAAADAAQKLVEAGILPADSDVTWERVGLDEDDRKRLREHLEGDPLTELFRTLDGQAQTDDDLKAKATALGVMIRAGVEPSDAARRVGLEGLQFTGERPTSLRRTETTTTTGEG
ncbi:MAG: phage portal protein [Actinobacteria bacterium]|nr:phage portal protein [Actinomycetota bacterium]